jgi:site-specific recombinase
MMLEDIIQRAKKNEAGPQMLKDLMRFLRPSSRFKLETAPLKMDILLNKLEEDRDFSQSMGRYLTQLFEKRKFREALTEIGIIGESGFISELSKRISYKVLPYQPNEDTLDYLLTNALYKSWDHLWIKKISNQQIVRFLHLTEIRLIQKKQQDSFAFNHLLFSVQVLSQQISAAGMSSGLLRMVPEYQHLDSPFISLQKELDHFIGQLTAGQGKNGVSGNAGTEHFSQLNVLIRQCRGLTEKAVRNKEKYGISFGTTIRILRLEQQLERLELIIRFIHSDQQGDPESQAVFIRQLIYFHAGKNQLFRYLKETTQLVAHQVTQHTGKTGEHYITTTRKEYEKMFWSAAGGGVVIGFLCLFKMLLSSTEASPFGHALYYSLNYALGFILIYFLHFTVATKQPAMTAAALAKALKSTKPGAREYENFTALFARLFRSQFIAFCGNVFFVFPTALLIVFVGCQILGENVVTPQKADKLLKEIDPFRSSAFFHAGIAGFHLFLSGLLSGYFVNKNIHHRVSYRFQHHPALTQVLPQETRARIAKWYDTHLGGLTSNFWLGVFLGTTGTIGMFFGMDWDIRHITFAAGNFALGIYGREFQISTHEIIISVLCIGGIGFINFSVSFIFSLLVALRARAIAMSELIKIAKAIFLRFIYSPYEFFFPPQEQKNQGTL